jgi:hypothetical protein
VRSGTWLALALVALLFAAVIFRIALGLATAALSLVLTIAIGALIVLLLRSRWR